MATLTAPLLVALVGSLAYAFSTNAKVGELGRISFFVGLLWLVFQLGHVVVHF